MTLDSITFERYQGLIRKDIISQFEVYELARYPFMSLTTYCANLVSNNEKFRIKNIEDKNILEFIKTVGLFFGIGSKKEVELLQKCIHSEPLQSALIAARQEFNPKKRPGRFIELGCKIMLSYDKKGTSNHNAINIKIDGKLPFRFSSTLNKRVDDWFESFVNLKLDGMKVVYQNYGAEKAYSFILASIAHSLYQFSPHQYSISFANNEDEALHMVLNQFFSRMNKYHM